MTRIYKLTVLTAATVLQGCASSSAGPGTSSPGALAACPAYGDLATTRIPDGRLVLQAFDSAAMTAAQHPRQVGRTSGRGPSAEDTITNRLLGVQVTSPPYLDSPKRVAMARQILEAYPPALRRAGIGGELVVVALVDTQGRVRETRIGRSSGHREMDNAAADVVRRARFEPALAGECRVPYVLRLPIAYTP